MASSDDLSDDLIEIIAALQDRVEKQDQALKKALKYLRDEGYGGDADDDEDEDD